jgi:hypothetical protein
MVRRNTIFAGLIIYCMVISPAFAGTWRDDFEDGDLVGWEGVNTSWNAEDGECSGEFFNAPSGILELIVTGDAGWEDYTVMCKMKFVVIGHFAGVSFRDNFGNSRYGFVINTQKNTAYAWKLSQGTVTTPSEIPLPFTPSKDTWYELKIIVEGTHFEFHIDGELVCEFDDNSIPSGKVGLCVRNAHAHFDDISISGDDVEDGGHWDPEAHPESKSVKPKGKLANMWGDIKNK